MAGEGGRGACAVRCVLHRGVPGKRRPALANVQRRLPERTPGIPQATVPSTESCGGMLCQGGAGASPPPTSPSPPPPLWLPCSFWLVVAAKLRVHFCCLPAF